MGTDDQGSKVLIPFPEFEHFPTYCMMSEFSHGLLVAGPSHPSIITPLLKSHFTSPLRPLCLCEPPSLISFLIKAEALQADGHVSAPGPPPY